MIIIVHQHVLSHKALFFVSKQTSYCAGRWPSNFCANQGLVTLRLYSFKLRHTLFVQNHPTSLLTTCFWPDSAHAFSLMFRVAPEALRQQSSIPFPLLVVREYPFVLERTTKDRHFVPAWVVDLAKRWKLVMIACWSILHCFCSRKFRERPKISSVGFFKINLVISMLRIARKTGNAPFCDFARLKKYLNAVVISETH